MKSFKMNCFYLRRDEEIDDQIGKTLVCGNFVFVLKLTDNKKIHFMKFAVCVSWILL